MNITNLHDKENKAIFEKRLCEPNNKPNKIICEELLTNMNQSSLLGKNIRILFELSDTMQEYKQMAGKAVNRERIEEILIMLPIKDEAKKVIQEYFVENEHRNTKIGHQLQQNDGGQGNIRKEICLSIFNTLFKELL